MKRLGKRVKALRQDRGLTQESMQNFGFNYRYYQKIEGGQVNSTLDTILKLSKALKCPVAELFKF